YLGETSTGLPVYQSMHYQAATVDLLTIRSDSTIEPKVSYSFPVNFKSVTFWDPYRKIVWCHTVKSFFTFNPVDGVMTPVNYKMDEFVKAIYFNPQGMVWIGTQDGVYLFTPK